MSDEESLEGGVTNPDTTLVAPSPLEYRPWHKPRKQYVRVKQWIHHSRGRVLALRAAGHFAGGVPLKYLTLPGPDLIDIRLMTELCTELDVKLHYTGFCTDTDDQQTRLRQNINQFRASNNTTVAIGSDVHKVALQKVVDKGSAAHNELQKGGPYQIVNIDACTPLLTGNSDATGRLIDAIKAVVEYQVNAGAAPWILLLTTPVQRDHISGELLNKLNAEIETNYTSSTLFAEALNQCFVDGENLEEFLRRMSQVHGEDFVNIATLGISKWLVHLGEDGGCRVKKMEGFCYSTFGAHPLTPNMISVCYLFEKQPVRLTDRSGLTRNQTRASNIPNPSDHTRALNRSFGMINVDDLMQGNHELYGDMIAETMGLLSDIGYSVEAAGRGYREWVESDVTNEHVFMQPEEE